jgi:lipoprotein-anchoring transpeptidase ErfK/SrfK
LKRGLSVVYVALGFVAAGALASVAVAGRSPSDPPHSVAARAATAHVTAPLKHVKHVKHVRHVRHVRTAIRPRVSIDGVRVGFLDRTGAASAVERGFARKLVVVIDGAVVRLNPKNLATPYVDGAVGKAWNAQSGTDVGLVVSVHGEPIRAVAAKLARRFDRRSVDATLSLKDGRPYVSPDRPARRLDEHALVAGVVRALATNGRPTLRFATTTTPAAVTSDDLRPVILINRSINRLTLYANGGLVRQFPVATGQAIYPTPAGRFRIVVKWKNPWWYPPTYDSWAKGLSPVPPGPNNPLGTRWMGLSAPGVGIHGTDEPGSIGYSASHGCIRMQVPDAEWLFDHVAVGTTVFIV